MEKKNQCDKNCFSCDINQRSYCSAQMLCRVQDMLAEIKMQFDKNGNPGNEMIILNSNSETENT